MLHEKCKKNNKEGGGQRGSKYQGGSLLVVGTQSLTHNF